MIIILQHPLTLASLLILVEGEAGGTRTVGRPVRVNTYIRTPKVILLALIHIYKREKEEERE